MSISDITMVTIINKMNATQPYLTDQQKKQVLESYEQVVYPTSTGGHPCVR